MVHQLEIINDKTNEVLEIVDFSDEEFNQIMKLADAKGQTFEDFIREALKLLVANSK